MGPIHEYFFLLNSGVVWAIFITAFICYGLLIELCFLRPSDEPWYERTQFWAPSLKHMLTALPLLGLLGTISGLLKTFTEMAGNKGGAPMEIISGGIGEALFTTQIGLLMVIPGLLMLAFLNFKRKGWIIQNAHEVIN